MTTEPSDSLAAMNGTATATAERPRGVALLRARGVALASNPHAPALAALAVYIGTALVLTWPVAVDVSSRIYGAGGDAFLTLGSLREANDSGVIPFLPGTIDSLAAPEGRAWSYPLSVATWLVTGPRWLASLVVGEVAAWNLWVLSGFILTGFATYLLVRRLTRSWPAAVIAGWAYAFYPFAAIRGGAHVEFSNGWPFVLLLWRALELRRSPTRRNGLWLGAALVVCLSFTPYYVLFGAVVGGVLLAGDLFMAWRKRSLRAHVTAWLWGLWMVPALLVVFVAVDLSFSGESQIRSHPIADLYAYAARPLDYVVPVPGSGFLHTSAFAGSYAKGIATGERGLYIGWTVLALALVGCVAVVRKAFDRAAREAAWLAALTGVVAAAFSAPPTYQGLGVTIRMPSWFVFQVSSTWRVYGRFVIVVMLAAVVLAGYGAAFLVRRRPRALGAGLALVIAALVVSDLWWRAQPATITLPDHPIYKVLAAQHDAAIAAEYPLAADEVPDYPYALGQDRHGHRLLNGYAPGSDAEHRALWLGPLDDPRTASRLAALGVRWVMLNEASPPAGAQPAGTPRSGFRLIRRVAGRSLWRVQAHPARALVYPAENFDRPEGATRTRYAWLERSTGTLRVDALGCRRPCAGVLHFVAASFASPRTLTLRAGGRVLTQVRVPVTPTLVSVPLMAGRDTEVELNVSPRPMSPRAVQGAPDDRTLAINVGEPGFRLTR